ncbi:MAG: hypothetical protein GY811_00370 [Myxococcales bacterium]|nr:hypothetical protein [Myxococcales bacterium]
MNAESTTALDAIVLKALSRDPVDRFQTADELATELDAVAADFGEPIAERTLAEWMRSLFPEAQENKRQLKKAALESRGSGQVRYGEALASAIAQCLAQLRDAGASWKECRQRLGVSNRSLHALSEKYSESKRTEMVRVRITEDSPGKPSSPGLLLCTPNGHRLSGFTLGEATQLLLALG